MSQKKTPLTIGSHTIVDFPKFGITKVPAKVDTGADASSIWASNVRERHGELSFTLFGEGSAFYTGEIIKSRDYKIRSIKNSFGNSELRYKVKIKISIEGIDIVVNFSLADRKDNQFPVLIGKRTLHGRFIVDVSRGRQIKNYKVLVLDVKKNSSVKGFLDKIKKENKRLSITQATFDELVFEINQAKTTVRVGVSGKEVLDFDFVFFKSVVEARDAASALAHYLEKRGIDFADRAILYYPLTNKLAQQVIFSDFGIKMPQSLFMDWQKTPDAYDRAVKSLGKPFIFKDVRESKGRNNYLIKSKAEFHSALKNSGSASFMAQKFLPNDGDYRVLIFGKKIRLVIKRSNQSNSTHLNNTSAGGTATLVKEETLPGEVRKNAMQAMAIMKLDVAGVDMVQDKESGLWYCLEVQHGPQITSGAYQELKRQEFSQYLLKRLANR